MSTPRLDNQDVRTKLAKILPLLQSDQPGERDGARLAVQRVLDANGLTWETVLASPPAAPAKASPSATGPTHSAKPPAPPPPHWRSLVQLLLADHSAWMSEWELSFCRSLPGFRHLSDKQLAVLHSIGGRLLKTTW